MKRFFKKSYSWLAMMVLTIMFAVSGSAQAAKAIEFSAAAMQTNSASHDGVTVTAAWWTGTQFNVYGDLDSEWGYLKVNSALGNIVKVEFNGPSGMNTITCTNGALTSATSTFSTWEGNTDEVIFHSSDDVYVNSITVYVEEGGTATEEVALEFSAAAMQTNSASHDGVTVTAAWWTGTQFNVYGDLDSEWGYLKVSSANGNITKVEFYGASGMNTITCTNGALTSATNAKSIWEGDTEEVIFHSSSDVYVDKVVVYINKSAVPVKDCSIDVDHFADNCKPGKVESISKWITLYMQANTLATGWTGGHNCPEGVTFTTEAGEEIPVDQFNYWAGSNQIGVNLYDAVTTPGVYTLHIPEGIVVFEGGKFNKEINATWTVVEPDLRPKKDVEFDFTVADFATNIEGVGFEATANYFASAQAIRVKTNESLTFTAPEKASIVKVSLVNESEKGNQPADFTANVGEINYSGYNINWEGDATNLVITSNYDMSVYFTKAIVTLAVEETEEPEVDPNEECFDAWKALINGQFADIAYENGYQVPEQDVPGKKPAAVAAPCVEYWSNRTAFVQLGFDWKTVNDYLGQLYQTTIVEDYAYAQALLEAYNAAEVVPEVVEPVQKDKYTIKLNGTDYYFTTTEVKDNDVTTYSISATPEYFYIEPNGNGYTIQSADTEKWVGYDVINSWDFSNDEKVWTIGNLEGEPTYIYKNGSKGFGVDGSFEGAGVYTDKSGQYWVVEKFVEGGEVVDPVVPAIELSELEGEWFFMGEGAYCVAPDNTDGSLSPKNVYTVNMTIEGDKLLVNGLVGYVYDSPNCMIGTYNAQAGTLSINTPYDGGYIVDGNYEYYLMNGPLVLNVAKDEAGNIVFSNENGWKFWYEDWYYTCHECGYSSVRMTKDAEMPEVEPNPELLQFAGSYLFKGVNAQSNDPKYTTDEYYECEVTVYGNELHMTGLIGEVDGKLAYLIGKYDPELNRIKFSHPGADGGLITAANGTKYYMDYFYVYVEGEEGSYVLNHTNTFNFYAYENGNYTKCSYDRFSFTQNGHMPEGWNGNIIFDEANSLDDLLTYTLEFEEAAEVKAAGTDVLGVVFEENGNPYAIVLANGVFDVFGSVKFQGGKATVEFVKIADLNAELQASAAASAKRIGGFATEGKASVVFAGKSFKVDGQLVTDIIAKDYEFVGGAITGIDAIENANNDVIYDLSGRRVVNTKGGLYIVNGRKVYMK